MEENNSKSAYVMLPFTGGLSKTWDSWHGPLDDTQPPT